MNAPMIAHREYVEQLHHVNEVTNKELLKFAAKYYCEPLSTKQQQDICSMPIEDKLWLLAQYKEEFKPNSKPDLSLMY